MVQALRITRALTLPQWRLPFPLLNPTLWELLLVVINFGFQYRERPEMTILPMKIKFFSSIYGHCQVSVWNLKPGGRLCKFFTNIGQLVLLKKVFSYFENFDGLCLSFGPSTQALKQGLGSKWFIREVILRSTLMACRSKMGISEGCQNVGLGGWPLEAPGGQSLVTWESVGRHAQIYLWKGKDRRYQPHTGWSEMEGDLIRGPGDMGWTLSPSATEN